MVLRYDADTREAIICAGWGADTDWVRNLPGRASGPGAARPRVVHPRSTGSCPMRRPSTSPSGSAASTRGGCACSARSSAETSVTTPRSAASSVPTRSPRSARRQPARPDQAAWSPRGSYMQVCGVRSVGCGLCAWAWSSGLDVGLRGGGCVVRGGQRASPGLRTAQARVTTRVSPSCGAAVTALPSSRRNLGRPR
jgi:hypothetical protein